MDGYTPFMPYYGQLTGTDDDSAEGTWLTELGDVAVLGGQAKRNDGAFLPLVISTMIQLRHWMARFVNSGRVIVAERFCDMLKIEGGRSTDTSRGRVMSPNPYDFRAVMRFAWGA